MRVTDPKIVAEYYRALLGRDESYRGVFVVGVRTTGIFCVSVCHARKPREENCEFFSEVREALRHGYRPCKVCRPLESVPGIPPVVRRAQDMLGDMSREGRVGDGDLRRAGISPEAVRRWYQERYGITFQAYQRMIRVNRAFDEIRGSTQVSEAAMNAGYGSLSGFGYTFRKLMDGPPSTASSLRRITMDRVDTPIGPMFAASVDEGLCLLEFTDRRMLERELEELQRRLKARLVYGRSAVLDQAETQLREYFAGARRIFNLPLVSPGSDFQSRVWEALRRIPYGTTTSYGQIAETLGIPGAVRAVGSANGHNRLAIVIPCHRVIGADGSLTGYGGGLDRKRWLLDHEAGDAPR